MARIFGSNTPDTLYGGLLGDRMRGWDAANPPGDTGPDTDHDELWGGLGDDTLWGGAGDDYLSGAEGNDRIFGGSGNDRLQSEAGRDALYGGDGDDLLIRYDVAGPGTLEGGAGTDWLMVNYALTSVAITFDLGAGLAFLPDGSRISGFERMVFRGSTAGDSLTGGALVDFLGGMEGDDTLSGGDGFDEIYGGTGNDVILGGAGAGYLVGEEGDDRLEGGAEADTVFGGTGRDTLLGGDGDDDLVGQEEADLLEGGMGHDRLWGGEGDDSLRGDGGRDLMSGGDGADTLRGGGHRDVLAGGAGADLLIGGFGFDVFDFMETPDGSVDHVADFAFGETVRLSGAAFGLAPGGSFGFETGSVATLADTRVLFDPATALLAFDADGAGGAAAIVFASFAAGTNLTAANLFIL
ncbi:calcium-binding protein [Stagnihabitans tardus]|uniref:Calcium-binding protein n=1 Tax=Stagnihabitans tardus TaxID=2699202 RepID=A0AAE4YCF1_9RHOB|nr:calcium-binding protein [Stagnihabitans tardus]NBZ89087.1 hypothetical protein [Stagnihabitans tardus]